MPKDNDVITPQSVSSYDWIKNASYSLITGGSVGVIFHPWDRALHLSVINQRRFFMKANFAKKWQGVGLVMMFKPITSGSYLFLQTELRTHLYPSLLQKGVTSLSANMIIGSICGSFDGFIKTPCNAIKANMWNHPGSTIWQTATTMARHGGYKAFFNGALMTIGRDAVFGAIYESTRCKLRAQVDNRFQNSTVAFWMGFIADSMAAGLATIGCSPLNYARMHKQSAKDGERPPSTFKIFKTFYSDTRAQCGFWNKAKHVTRSLGVGPGTLRVMADMPTKQFVLIVIPGIVKYFQGVSADPSQKPVEAGASAGMKRTSS